MAQYTGPLLAVAAIGALGSYTPSEEFQRNAYSNLDDCRRDNAGDACAVEQTDGEARAFGPWHIGEASLASASLLAVAVVTETRRGGFGGWSCGPGGGDRDRRGGGG